MKIQAMLHLLDATLTYLLSQRGRLGDYHAWRRARETIGSSMMEREVVLVVNRPMKRRGRTAGWNRVGTLT